MTRMEVQERLTIETKTDEEKIKAGLSYCREIHSKQMR